MGNFGAISETVSSPHEAKGTVYGYGLVRMVPEQ